MRAFVRLLAFYGLPPVGKLLQNDLGEKLKCSSYGTVSPCGTVSSLCGFGQPRTMPAVLSLGHATGPFRQGVHGSEQHHLKQPHRRAHR